ncbi:HAD-IC family P-type ATPase [Streptomyces marispadix]|uniref:Cation-translocating P-type ATPase n=1 Tax=Streptomyces marispadix TaxID=2922868 RepID=A0ABS9SXI0_9ACTN|nr:HAD-IC family P-type ATPase [Streptomyces marispadix]MCH6160961.1 cation-translocating P-type ATPase [Streptomyces marispadix]
MTERTGAAGTHTGDGPQRGLSAAEVAARTARGEINDVPVRSSRSLMEIVRANVFTRFNAIIGVLFVIILFVGPVQDSLFGFVILANTLIGIVQELRAKRTLDNLAVIGEVRPLVRRDGTGVSLSASQIVLGDLIEIRPGDKCVVDGEVTEADSLEIDESLLTGEADPVVKQPGDPVMSGSFVVAGSGAFTATRVGRAAYAAQLAEEASRFTLVHSELRNGINDLLKYVTWVIVPTGVGLVLSQLVVEQTGLENAVRRMVGGIAPMVPEGLVLLTSIAFAIGVVRLGRKKCLVQELPAIEGLARVDVVCLDKTGTLTEGGMDVAEVRVLRNGVLRDGPRTDGPPPDGDGQSGDGQSGDGQGGDGQSGDGQGGDGQGGDAKGRDAKGEYDGAYVARVLAALGSADPRPNASMRAIVDAYPRDAHLLGGEGGGGSDGGDGGTGKNSRTGKGDGGTGGTGSLDGAGSVDGNAHDGHPDRRWGLGPWQTAQSLPFSSARKYSGATLVEPDGTRRTWLLGAPDVLLPRGHPATADVEQLSREGLRVLLLAATDRGPDAPEAVDGARPAALVVLQQRLRPDAGDILRYFNDQGVAAKVLSGDNAVSVGAVAAELRLPGAHNPVDAGRLPGDAPGVVRALESGTVFGRVTPRQKQTMVGSLQEHGHHVAMTGDGVNDVLALKNADIGVAMGTGSEATRAVAQIVLLDDSFASLPSVVAEGRRVIGNIERVANLFLTKTVYSVLLALLVIAWQVPYPFLPRHLTLVSSLTIGIPAFFLALAPNRERAKPHFVGRVMRYSVPAGLVAGAATFATYLLARGHYAGPGALAAETSVATLTLFLIAMWVLAIVARPYSWWRVGLVLTMGLGFVVVLAIPVLQRFFALRLVGTAMPLTSLAVAAASAVALEIIWVRVARRGNHAGRRPTGSEPDTRD